MTFIVFFDESFEISQDRIWICTWIRGCNQVQVLVIVPVDDHIFFLRIDGDGCADGFPGYGVIKKFGIDMDYRYQASQYIGLYLFVKLLKN